MPVTAVSSLTITLEDQSGNKVEKAKASFFDDAGQKIIDVELGKLPSWGNNIHWWAHTYHKESILRPSDARRAKSVLIEAENCESFKLPLKVIGKYTPPYFLPHGAGPAYMYYEFSQTVKLTCTRSESAG